MGLQEYRRKRDFKKTGEPRGSTPSTAAKGARRRVSALKSPPAAARPASAPGPASDQPLDARPGFVVQKHNASRLHYDFRLEMDGVLKSWAVPKGPSLDPAQKRLAVRTEDHPLEYRDFEGVIPEGEYGAGAVMVWDFGPVRYETGEAEAAALVEARKPLAFELQGRKLRGRFRLVPFAARGETPKNWLLIKSHDDAATQADVLLAQPDSTKTGRTLDEIAAAGEVWQDDEKRYGD